MPLVEGLMLQPLPSPVIVELPLLSKLYRAVLTLPQGTDWGLGLVLLLGYALIALLWGQRSALLRWQPVTSPQTIAITLGIALIVPALMEETLFRVLLLPDPNHAYFYGWAVGGLMLFILAHPLNALLFFPHRKETFFNPHFLALAGLLGLICTIAYQQSESLWLPVLLHWIPVGLWLLLWGGLERMSPQETTAPQGEEWREP
jgi:predicted Abi (CAAX) family protease